jgi:hypothetical protein
MTIRALCLLLAPASLLAGCSQSPDQAELQERLTAAEARADAAEKRAKNAEAMAQQHAQEPPMLPPVVAPPVAQPEVAQGNGDYGEPVNDTAPIEPVPAVNPNNP